jgi:gliding motility-associated-like protein
MNKRKSYISLTFGIAFLLLHATVMKAEFFFTENKGQVKNQHWQPRPDVLFSGAQGGFEYYMKQNGLQYQIKRVISYTESDPLFPSEKQPDSIGIYRVDIDWLRASPDVQIEKGEAMDFYENFYNTPLGIDSVMFVKSYRNITYKNIYEGIDLKFYEGAHSGLEYDFIVHPHADFRQIKMRIKGAKISTDKEGRLLLKTPYGEIAEGALKVFQEEKEVAAHWVVKGNVVGISVTGKYDAAKPLRIDPPVRLWGTYYYANGGDFTSCASDGAGNVYVSGGVAANNMATSGAHQTILGQGGSDGFLAKFNGNGQRIWATYYGGPFSDRTVDCAVDGNAFVYVVGMTQSVSGIASAGSYQSALNGNASDMFLAKFDANGVRQWGTYFGGANADVCNAGTVDAAGNLYVCGYASSTTAVFGSPGAHQTSHGGGTGQDCVLAKFDTNGQRVWSTYYGGNRDDRPGDVALDASGANVYLCGSTSSAGGIATAGTHQPTFNLIVDGFVAKFNSNGVLQWGTYYGGADYDYLFSCGVDGSGNVYAFGQTTSTAGIATTGTHQQNYTASNDGYLFKLNGTNGQRIWGTYYGGSGIESLKGIEVSSTGEMLVSGYTTSPNQIATAGSHQPALAGTSNAFLSLFNTNGLQAWGTYYGGSEYDMGFDCAFGTLGSVYLCGTAGSPSGIATAGTYQPTLNNNNAAFLAKFEACTSPVISASSNAPFCAGNTLQLNTPTVAGATYQWSGVNNFTSSQQNPSIPNATSSVSGIYTVTVTNNSGCSATASVNVLIYAVQNLTAGSNSPICEGQMLNLTATPLQVQSYTWSGVNSFSSTQQNPNIPNVTTAQAGTYSVTILDWNGCTATSSVNVIITNPPVVTASSNSPVCAGQPLNLSVNNIAGATYSWSGASGFTSNQQNPTIASPATAASGNYTVTVSVGSSCTASGSTNVTVNPAPTVNASSNSPVCAGQNLNLSVNATAGATYLWSGANGFSSSQQNPVITSATANAAGTYTVTVTANGCSSTGTGNVSVNTPPAATASANSPICEGQTLNLSVNNSTNATYSWSGANGFSSAQQNPSVNNTSTAHAGNYSVTVSVPGCGNATSSVNVVVNPSPTVNITRNSPVCEGGDLNLNVNATVGAAYTWSGANGFSSSQQNPQLTSVSLNAAGAYSVTVTAAGCSRDASVNVAVNPLPAVAASYNAPLCEGSDLNLSVNATPNATYQWSGVNGFSSAQQNPVVANVQTSQAGVYSVTVTANGCSSNASVNVSVNTAAILNVTATANPPTVCAGESSALTASGADSYVWSNGLGAGASQNVSPQTSTAYQVTATDAQTGCTATASVSVNVNPLPAISIAASQTVLCESGTVTLTANGGNIYQWNGGETTAMITVSPTATTDYTVTATDANGCSSTATQTVSVLNFSAPQFAFGNSFTLCYGKNAPALPAASQNGISGAWQPAAISNTQNGIYTFTPDAGQCAADYVLNVTVQQIGMTVSPDTMVDLATTVQLFAAASGSTGGNYQWSPTDNLSCSNCSIPKFFALRSTIFTATYTDAQTGCSASADVYVEVNYDPNTVYYVPNVFSPNRDGSNDFFEIYGQKIKEIDLNVFNRWGELVFSEKSANPRWDGYYGGEAQPAGVYVYHTYIVFYNGKTVQNKGSVTLMR